MVNANVRNIKLTITKFYSKKHVGAKFPTCPCCTVLRLRSVQLQVLYFTNFIPFARHNQISANNLGKAMVIKLTVSQTRPCPLFHFGGLFYYGINSRRNM